MILNTIFIGNDRYNIDIHIYLFRFNYLDLVIYIAYSYYLRDVTIITALDTVTSMVAGCTIFGILGNLAYELGIEDISKVVKSGAGLAFISYPDAIAKFQVIPQVYIYI